MRALLPFLFLGGVFLSWEQGWMSDAFSWSAGLPKGAAGASVLEERIRTNLMEQRRSAGLSVVAADQAMQTWLCERVRAGAVDPGSLAESAREAWPQYQEVWVVQADGVLADKLQRRVATWPEACKPEATHLAVVVEPGPHRLGWRATVLAGSRLPVLSPETLADPTQEKFYTTCPLCHSGQPCKIPRKSRLFKLRCQSCNRGYAMLAADSDGRFRYVNEFLTGYMPPNHDPPAPTKLAELMSIWRAETWRCRYVPDAGGEDDDAWQTAEETYNLKQGDCEDSAILLTDWLLARGFEARLAIGRYDKSGDAHAWVVVRLDGYCYVLESTEFPFNLQRPPLASEVGTRYAPALMFDRNVLFTPKTATWTGDYWGEDTWQRVPARPQADAPVAKL